MTKPHPRDFLQGKNYPRHIPSEAEIPPGAVVAHNNVRPARRQGTRGFRFWTQARTAEPKLVRCGCGWAPELREHFVPAAWARRPSVVRVGSKLLVTEADYAAFVRAGGLAKLKRPRRRRKEAV